MLRSNISEESGGKKSLVKDMDILLAEKKSERKMTIITILILTIKKKQLITWA